MVSNVHLVVGMTPPVERTVVPAAPVLVEIPMAIRAGTAHRAPMTGQRAGANAQTDSTAKTVPTAVPMVPGVTTPGVETPGAEMLSVAMPNPASVRTVTTAVQVGPAAKADPVSIRPGSAAAPIPETMTAPTGVKTVAVKTARANTVALGMIPAVVVPAEMDPVTTARRVPAGSVSPARPA